MGYYYIVDKWKEGQKRFFTCKCCGKKFDFGNSDEYKEAVFQWERFGGKCYACGRGLCHCGEEGHK